MNSYKLSEALLKTKDFKSIRIRTYDIFQAKSFRMRTCENREGGGVPKKLSPINRLFDGLLLA
jgi:hypothetical protein